MRQREVLVQVCVDEVSSLYAAVTDAIKENNFLHVD
jgi:hypothetical protein